MRDCGESSPGGGEGVGAWGELMTGGEGSRGFEPEPEPVGVSGDDMILQWARSASHPSVTYSAKYVDRCPVGIQIASESASPIHSMVYGVADLRAPANHLERGKERLLTMLCVID